VRKNNIHVVVLCDCVNDEGTPLMSQSPMAGWPVWGKSSFTDFLKDVAQSEDANVTVSHSGHQSFWTEMKRTGIPEQVKLIQEKWPVGSAGAVCQALSEAKDGLAVIYTGNRLYAPSVETLVTEHRALGSDLSVVVNPDGQTAGIYVCDVAVKDLIPEEGYSDIKEFLIPAIIRRGKDVKALTLSENVGAFSDWQGYLHTVLSHIESIAEQTSGLVKRISSDMSSVWASEDQEIPDTCLFSGRVIIMPGADIGLNCMVQGPAIIGANAKVQENAVISRSILWDGVCVGSNCVVRESIIGRDSNLCHGVTLSNETYTDNGVAGDSKEMTRESSYMVPQIRRYVMNMKRASSPGPLVSIAAMALCLVWSYWTTIENLWTVWMRSDEYSSGMLVPVLAGYVLWLRRGSLGQIHAEWSVLGLVGLLVAQAFRLFGLVYMYGSAERLSIVMTIGSCVLLLGGKEWLKKTLTVLLFLVLMLPWPARLQSRIALPLQEYATRSAVFSLETLGYDVIKGGTVIHIGDTSVAVAEACNGLRMITAFFVIAGLVALIARRSVWEKAVIFLSSLPIALVCNTIRLAITAIAFTMIKGEAWEQVFHDFGGYAMMPLALGIIVFELWIMSLLTIEPAEEEELVIRRESRSTQETTR